MPEEAWLNTKGISSIRSPSQEKMSKMCWNIWIFWRWPKISNLDHCYIWAHKGGIFKSCPWVLKLRIWLLRGWGRCLKVTLQNVHRKFPAHGAPSGGSRMCRPVREDPHRHESNLRLLYLVHVYSFLPSSAQVPAPAPAPAGLSLALILISHYPPGKIRKIGILPQPVYQI